MVGQWGVLHNTRGVLDNRYSGSVFVRAGATGHMFIQHYLDVMFPLPKSTPRSPAEHDAEEGVAFKTSNSFLDKVVDVDEKTATRRESTAAQKLGIMRQDSGFEDFVIEEEVAINGDNGGLGQDGESRAGLGGPSGQADRAVRAVGQEAKGKTTRELSRLWTYLHGGAPVDGGMRQAGS